MKEIRISVMLPTWYEQTFQVEDEDVIEVNGETIINPYMIEDCIDKFDFSEAEQFAEYRFRNVHHVEIFACNKQIIQGELETLNDWLEQTDYDTFANLKIAVQRDDKINEILK